MQKYPPKKSPRIRTFNQSRYLALVNNKLFKSTNSLQISIFLYFRLLFPKILTESF